MRTNISNRFFLNFANVKLLQFWQNKSWAIFISFFRRGTYCSGQIHPSLFYFVDSFKCHNQTQKKTHTFCVNFYEANRFKLFFFFIETRYFSFIYFFVRMFMSRMHFLLGKCFLLFLLWFAISFQSSFISLKLFFSFHFIFFYPCWFRLFSCDIFQFSFVFFFAQFHTIPYICIIYVERISLLFYCLLVLFRSARVLYISLL